MGVGGRETNIAREHPGPLDVCQRPIESTGDGALQVPFTQTNSEVAAEHLHDRSGCLTIAALEQLAQRLGFGLALGRGDRGEGGVNLSQRRRLVLRLVVVRGQQIAHGLAQVGREVVARTESTRGRVDN